jgi:uncharacterized protein DUF6875
MQLLTPTTNDPDRVFPGLATYMTAMTGHCPYLGPSLGRDLTTWAGYAAGSDDCAALLGLLVDTAEAVRASRRTHGPLACANIAIIGPTDITTARAVVDWPHWIARNLYAPVGLMIGKFWIGEAEEDKLGRPIMPPPVSFFSIRHSYPVKDARFLHALPAVAAALDVAVDDGRDILHPHLGVLASAAAATNSYDTLKAAFPATGAQPAHSTP